MRLCNPGKVLRMLTGSCATTLAPAVPTSDCALAAAPALHAGLRWQQKLVSNGRASCPHCAGS